MNQQHPVALVWFRHDLRIEDNAALDAAASSGARVICVFVDVTGAEWARGGASKVVLAEALLSLRASLKKIGADLLVLKVESEQELIKFCEDEGVTQVFWNRRYDRYGVGVDSELKRKFVERGITAVSFKGSVLVDPFDIKQGSGNPYQVYTPFLKVYERQLKLEPVIAAPEFLRAARATKPEEAVEAHLDRWLPKIAWDTEIRRRWVMSESEALTRLKMFLNGPVARYRITRDLPFEESGTSRLSPYLALGVISPRQIFWHISEKEDALFSSDPGIYQYQKEIIWREFGTHLIYHFPTTDLEPLRKNFKNFEWQDNEIHLDAWQRGQTGYPIVDAAMRELWQTGWMHNRARMIVASFLVKHLRIHWLEGARWFWDTLVDADLASNTLGWQWSAGCGADAAPYFRIFNPVLQGERFDVEGEYVKRWVPELGKVPTKWIHQPWEAPEEALAKAGVKLGTTYPLPIVDHKTERDKALSAFKKISVKL